MCRMQKLQRLINEKVATIKHTPDGDVFVTQ